MGRAVFRRLIAQYSGKGTTRLVAGYTFRKKTPDRDRERNENCKLMAAANLSTFRASLPALLETQLSLMASNDISRESLHTNYSILRRDISISGEFLLFSSYGMERKMVIRLNQMPRITCRKTSWDRNFPVASWYSTSGSAHQRTPRRLTTSGECDSGRSIRTTIMASRISPIFRRPDYYDRVETIDAHRVLAESAARARNRAYFTLIGVYSARQAL